MNEQAHETGPIQNFIATLYSGAFYAVAPGLGLGAGVRNLLILVTLLGFITSMRVSAAVGTLFENWQAGVEAGRIPVLSFTKDSLSVVGPQPWTGYGPNGVMAVVDTAARTVTLPDSVSGGVFLGRHGGFYRNGGRTLQPLSYDLLFGLTGGPLDGPGVVRLRKTILPLVVVLWGGALAFFYLVGNTLLVLFLAGPGYWLGRRVRKDLRYAHVLTLALFVITPIALLFLAAGLVQPDLALGLWPLYPALSASLLMSKLRRWLLPPPEPGSQS